MKSLVNIAPYIAARALPAAINFALYASLTHVLTPAAFGRYSVAFATIVTVNLVAIHWVRLAILRYTSHPDAAETIRRLAVRALSVYTIVGVMVAATIAIVAQRQEAIPAWLAVAAVAAPAFAWFESSLEQLRARERRLAYAVAAIGRAALACSLSLYFASRWQTESAVLLGGLVGSAVVSAVLYRNWTRRSGAVETKITHAEIIRFSLPLAVTLSLDAIVNYSDRAFVAAWHGDAAAGTYASGYDLINQSLGVVAATLNLGVYPAVVRTFDKQGPTQAADALNKFAATLLSVFLPITAFLFLEAPTVTSLALGPEFRTGAAQILPWVALAATLNYVRAFYFDVPFQLARRTATQLRISVASTGVNLGLNVALIPRFALQGALAATLGSYLLSLGLSWYYGRKHMVLSLPKLLLVRIAAGCGLLWCVGLLAANSSLVVRFVAYTVLLLLGAGVLWRGAPSRVGLSNYPGVPE